MSLELELKKIGLSDKEAKVYLALLELGEAGVQAIAEKADVNRATTYVVLEELQKQGMVSTVEKDKKTVFIAGAPRALLRMFRTEEREIKEREDDFKKALPELEAIFNTATEKPTVKFFEGAEGIRAIREDILNSGTKIIHEIYPLEYVEQTKSLFLKEEEDEFMKKKIELGVTTRAIYASETGPFSEFKSPGERKFVSKDIFPFSADILIYGNKIGLITLKGKLISIIIESEEIANTLRLIFQLAWTGADKTDTDKN